MVSEEFWFPNIYVLRPSTWKKRKIKMCEHFFFLEKILIFWQLVNIILNWARWLFDQKKILDNFWSSTSWSSTSATSSRTFFSKKIKQRSK